MKNRTGSYIHRVRWEKAEASLQRAWDADNRRSTEATRMRLQRAFDQAQKTKYLYEKAIGEQVNDGYRDNYAPEDE